MKNKSWAREEALRVINKVIRENAYSNIAVKHGLEDSELSRVDKALVTEIVNGTLRNLIRIDWIIAQFTSKGKSKIAPIIEDILRCGVYQIFFLDRIPDSAVCNESAELARRYGHEGVVKFVNGVLRNIVRNKDKIDFPDKEKDIVKYLSITYSHPEWIIEKWLQDFGAEFTEQLLAADNITPQFTIRYNKLKTTKDELKQLLKEENIEFEDGLYNQEALYLKGTSSIEERKSFKKGYYQVQDESSMLVAHVVAPREGDLVLDVCSAPGGKTTHLAELMNNSGKIIARDIHKHKLKLIEDSCKRLGITNVETQLFNAKEIDLTLKGTVDRVLVDAPCSGLGVMRRKPDLRWKKKPDNFEELVKIQLDILEKSSQYVKPGGTLVYSTCTINKSENIELVRSFLKSNTDFILDDITESLPFELRQYVSDNGMLELYPSIHNTDGFFIARMQRKQ